MSETLAQRAELRAKAFDVLGFVKEASIIRALAAANAQLERERDAARKIAENLAIEAVAALHEGETLRRERDAATAALAKAEGERDRMQEVLRSVLPHAWAAEYHDDWIGDGVRREACTTAEAALTPAPEAPKDGE